MLTLIKWNCSKEGQLLKKSTLGYVFLLLTFVKR